MAAAANNKDLAKKYNIDQNVAREFIDADKEAGLWQDEEEDDISAAIAAGDKVTMERLRYLIPPKALKFHTIHD